jgi:bacillopeptidase F
LPLWIINGLAVTAKAEVIKELSDLPGVESIRLDGSIEAPLVESALSSTPEWNLETIHAPQLWNLGYKGQGVVIAGMDTGVDVNHPDLSGKWRGGNNSWYDPNNEHSTPYDADGHGTRTMGVMVGGSSGGTSIGVAPDAKWIAVKIFNDAGNASFSAIHQGFQWILDPDNNAATNDAPDVVHNSWGLRNNINQCITEFQDDIRALKAAQISVVFSAGNEGPNASTSVSPANYPENFAVGAVDENLAIAGFSSRGPSTCDGAIYPEVVAPGVNIKTSDLTFGGVFPNSYAYVSGTSFSSPHVAGSIAVLTGAYPNKRVIDFELALKESAIDLGVTGPDNVYGYGLMNAIDAYNILQGSVQCTDTDRDGYFIEAGCGSAQDCNDNSALIYPGAQEIKHDGIDQDCNGYDLTIDILKALYTKKRDTLSVEAASALGRNANLVLLGYGPMSWNKKTSRWSLSLSSVGGNPGTVTVSGPEGSVSAQTVVK